MTFIEALILGVLQGITEFLPISSSGHLVLGETFLGLEVESLKSFDVVVHMGTLAAIVIYFWRDVVGLFKGLFAFIGIYKISARLREYQKLVGYIILASVPAVLAGLFLEDTIDFLFRDALYVGLWMIIVGEIFILSEGVLKKFKKEVQMGWFQALIIGLAQAVALIPGVSRSGSTIAAGLFQGVTREKAARFSFLMAMPVIFGAGLLTLVKEMKGGGFDLELVPLVVGFVASMLAGFAAVYFLMKFLKTHTLKAFAIYLFVVGGVTVVWYLFFST